MHEEKFDNSEQHSPKQSQVTQTLKWLTENYERSEGVRLPRCVLYTHYLDFCKKRKFTPAGAATFGKKMMLYYKAEVPKANNKKTRHTRSIKLRTTGTRYKEYHYYGIGIKESSVYYHSVYSGKGLTRFSGIKIKTEGSNRKYSLSSKTGTLLPDFPDSDNLILQDGINGEKMQTFIMMCRTHCQRILDTTIRANFEEIQNFLLHFWQGMPEHLVHLLTFDVVANVIGLCDCILYKVLIDVLIPSTIQDLPDSLCSEIKLFVKSLPIWLENSMENVPEHLREKKMAVAKSSTQSIRRQISFVQLAQTARTVLLNHEGVTQMMEDVNRIDFTEITCQAGYLGPDIKTQSEIPVITFFDEFLSLLGKQAPIEPYTEWMDTIIDQCVLHDNQGGSKLDFEGKAASFLLQWTVFGSLMMRDLTLHSASSFGSFHLIHMMLDEYVFLVMETQQEQVRERHLQGKVQAFMKNTEEIKTQPKIRTPSKSQLSPKCRKRKGDDESSDINEMDSIQRFGEKGFSRESYYPDPGITFTRPQPSINRDINYSYPDKSSRCAAAFASLPVSPMKHYQSPSASSYDCPRYIPPQYGLAISYCDYVSPNSSFSGQRIHGYGASHGQLFASFSSTVSPSTGNYWSDNSSHSGLHDLYGAYSYNKLPSYDSIDKSSFLRTGGYQDTWTSSRPAFDTTRGYYRGTHENFQVGSAPSVNTCGGNFMDIPQYPGQYGRQGRVLYQADIHAGNITGYLHTMGKPYITTPFR